MMTNQFLFICGTPRSGTTALWRLLACDERLIMGVERYGNLFFKTPLTADLFTAARFLDLQPGDTFYDDLVKFNPYYQNLAGRFGNAQYIGDKIPLLYNYLDRLFQHLPSAKVVILLRNIVDVAASYEARANNPDDHSWKRDKRTASAIQDWRSSLLSIKRYVDDPRVLPIVYEDFFTDPANLANFYQFLALPVSQAIAESYQNLLQQGQKLEQARKRDLPLASVRLICETAPFGLYREVLEKIKDRPLA